MDISDATHLIGKMKILAQAINKVKPGSCTDIIKDLDNASANPAIMKQRSKDLQEKFEELKDNFSQSDLETLKSSGLDVANPETWGDGIEWPELSEGGIIDTILEGIGEFLKELFS